MKKIKPVVLKDATKLTNSEMKKIRGGYDPGNDHSAACTVQCPAEFGGSSVTAQCRPSLYCDIQSGINSKGIPFYGAGCYYQNVYPEYEEPKSACLLTESLK